MPDIIRFWALMFIFVIISTGALIVARDGQQLARRDEKAICIEIQFLEGSARVTAQVASKTKDPELRKVRLQGVKSSLLLAQQLRTLGIDCV